MPLPRWLPTSLAVTVAVAGAPGLAQTELQSSLKQAVEAYEQLEFERCVELLSALPAPEEGRDAGELAQAALYRGLCRFNLAQPAPARDDFRQALTWDPLVRLPRGVSPRAAELFQSAQEEQAALRTPAVEVKPPPPEPLATSTSHAPFTLGPVMLGGAGVVAAGFAGYFGVQAKRNEALANAARYALQADQYAGRATQSATAANISWGCAGAALVSAGVWWAVQRFTQPAGDQGTTGASVSSQTLSSHWLPVPSASKLDTGP